MSITSCDIDNNKKVKMVWKRLQVLTGKSEQVFIVSRSLFTAELCTQLIPCKSLLSRKECIPIEI